VSVKSVLDIEVNAAAFERYKTLFDRYSSEAAKQPALWKALGYTHTANANAFTRMTAAVQAQARVQKEIGDVYKSQNRQLMQGERLWGSMATHAKGIASSLISATRSLISWTGIIGAAGGLLGAGGLFGIDRMARSVSGERRSATGLGLSIGEQKAFDVTFGQRLVDSGSFLGWINQMEMDPRKGAYAGAIGVGLSGKTGPDAVSMLRAIRSRTLGTDPRMRGMLPEMMHWEGVSGEDVRRLGAMSNREFEGLAGSYGRDVGKLNISDPTAEKWTSFIQRLDEAKGAIYKTFVQGLAPLEKPLEHLSGAFEKFVLTLMKSDLVKHAIEGLAEWLEKFSGKISAPKFLEAVERFTSDMGELADAAHVMAHPREAASKAWAGTQSWLSDRFMQVFRPDDYYKYGKKEETAAFLSRIDAQNKLPAGTMARVWQRESGSSFNPPDSKKGATGPFQMLPVTAASFGADPHSFVDSAGAAGYYLKQLTDRYKGDTQKALAAYNWGPANVDWDVKQHGKDWQRYAPAETRGYVAATSGSNVNVTVNITTPPGSDLTATASAVAH
jgi:hypothetical protein